MTTDGEKQKIIFTMYIIITVNNTSTDSYYFWVIAIGQALF